MFGLFEKEHSCSRRGLEVDELAIKFIQEFGGCRMTNDENRCLDLHITHIMELSLFKGVIFVCFIKKQGDSILIWDFLEKKYIKFIGFDGLEFKLKCASCFEYC